MVDLTSERLLEYLGSCVDEEQTMIRVLGKCCVFVLWAVLWYCGVFGISYSTQRCSVLLRMISASNNERDTRSEQWYFWQPRYNCQTRIMNNIDRKILHNMSYRLSLWRIVLAYGIILCIVCYWLLSCLVLDWIVLCGTSPTLLWCIECYRIRLYSIVTDSVLSCCWYVILDCAFARNKER